MLCLLCLYLGGLGKKNNKPENFGERKLMLNATFVNFGDLVCVNDA